MRCPAPATAAPKAIVEHFPAVVMRTMTKMMEGSEYRMSTIRISRASTLPPMYPATAPHNTPMSRLTTAPTAPTSSEICPPYSVREKTSRPWTSVPNQCRAPGRVNCTSDSRSGLWSWAKCPPASFKPTGQAAGAASSAPRNQALQHREAVLVEPLPGPAAGELAVQAGVGHHSYFTRGSSTV